MGNSTFRINDIEIDYKDIHYIGLKEIYVLDIYRVGLIKKGDIVFDLGAGIGDFTVIASKKVGDTGRVVAIEPNIEDYELLQSNLRRNNCSNVTTLNMGIGGRTGEKEITFWGRTYKFKIDTLEQIMSELGINQPINFIKMDIEGAEREVIESSLSTIAKANVISIEFHGTKVIIDSALSAFGYDFRPVTMRYVYRNILKTLLLYPRILLNVYRDTLKRNPAVVSKAFKGLDMTKEHFLVGSYVRGR